jgi:hypothetical protein
MATIISHARQAGGRPPRWSSSFVVVLDLCLFAISYGGKASSRWEGASTLSPSANTIFAPIPGSGGDQNYFHADSSFTIMNVIIP